MESEKVKEIKEVLEQEKNTAEYRGVSAIVSVELLKDTLTLINELESENETLKDCYRVKAYDCLRKENKQLNDRIAELEKENAKWIKEVEDRKAEVLHLQEYGKKLIRETELKQFAERLKDKMTVHYPSVIKSIDETLKEFINE